MKKNLLIIILCVNFTNFLQAQDLEIELKNTFETYRTYVEQKNYDKAYDYFLDSFLVYVPKEKLLKELASITDNDKIDYSISHSQIKNISGILHNDNKDYAFIKYGALNNYQFTKKADKKYIKQIQNNLKAEYDTNYTYSKKERKITVYKEQELVAIRDKEWKFIPYKEKLKPFLHMWIPQQTLLQLYLIRGFDNNNTKK